MYRKLKPSSNKNIIIIPKKTEQHNFKNDVKVNNNNNKSYDNIRKIVENNSNEKQVEKSSITNEKKKLNIV